MEVRALTPDGIFRFESYLRQLDNSTEPIQKPDLNVDAYSSTLDLETDIHIDENKKFESRLDIGQYLHQRLGLAGVTRGNVITEQPELWMNVWSWLAYVWLDHFVSVSNGVHLVRAMPRYVGSNDWNRFYRHYVSTPYYVFSLHQSYNSKLFLECPPSVHNEMMEQIGSRQWIISSKRLVELAHVLYWNREKDRAKIGASGKGRGTARRFGKILNQFMLTYDVHEMNVEEMMALMPIELREWTEKS